MDLNLDADLDTLLSTLHPPWTADAGIRTRIEDLHRVNPGSTDTGNTGSLNNESNATTSATKRSKTSPNIHPENVPAAPPVAASPTSAPVAPSSMDRERVSNQQNATPSSSAPTDSTSFPEMIYVTDELGNILTLKDPETWNVWLSRNCSSNVSPARMERSRCPTVVGRNLFEYIADVKVASFTRHIIYMLGSEQQDSFKYFWFCDTPTHERKMIMNVTCHQAFEDSKLIVWASRIVYERELFVPQSWLLRENLSMPASETPSSGQKDGNPSDSPNVNRSVCSYCKRIMVLVGDIDPQIANALIDSSSAMPASMIYDDQIPFLGARGRRGIQPVTAMTASSSTPNDSSTLLQGSTDVSQCFRGSVPSSAGSIGTKDVSDGATSINCAAPASSAINLAASVGVPSETVVEPPSIQLSVQQVVSHLWLSPYQYYYVAKLSDAGVSITNSVCEVCYGEIGYLFFRRGTFVGGVRQPVVTALGDCVANVHEAEVRRLIDGETRTLAGQSSGRKRKSDGGSASSTVSGSAGGGGSGTNFGNPIGEYTGLPADKRQRGVAPKPTRLSISDVASGGF